MVVEIVICLVRECYWLVTVYYLNLGDTLFSPNAGIKFLQHVARATVR